MSIIKKIYNKLIFISIVIIKFFYAFIFFLQNNRKTKISIFDKKYNLMKKAFNFKIKQKIISKNFKTDSFVTLENIYINSSQYILSDLEFLYTRRPVEEFFPFQYAPHTPKYIYSANITFGYCFLGRERKNYSHNIMDIYFAIYLKKTLKINGDIIFFGKLTDTDNFFLNAINFKEKISIVPDKFYAVNAKQYIFLPNLYWHDKSFKNYFIDYTNKIVEYCMQDTNNKKIIKYKNIFAIRRGYARKTVIDNLIENLFEEKDYKLINFDDYGISDQIRLMKNCDILAGFHGSNLMNSTFMKNGKLVEIVTHSEHTGNGCYTHLAEMNNNKHFELDIMTNVSNLKDFEIEKKLVKEKTLKVLDEIE